MQAYSCARVFDAHYSVAYAVREMITADEIRTLIELLDMTQGEFAARVGVTQPTVSRWLRGQVPDPAQERVLTELLTEQSELFERDNPRFAKPNLRMEEIRRHQAQQTADRAAAQVKNTPPSYTAAPEAPEFDKANFPRDVPLLGITACGDDASFILNGQSGDYVRRPPGIAGRRSVYALNVFGESMYPVYRHNALVYVDPNRTPAVTEDAVIELHPEDPRDNEPGKGFLKRVKSMRGNKIICEQFNPPEEVVFERSEIKSFHRVIPLEELLGY